MPRLQNLRVWDGHCSSVSACHRHHFQGLFHSGYQNLRQVSPPPRPPPSPPPPPPHIVPVTTNVPHPTYSPTTSTHLSRAPKSYPIGLHFSELPGSARQFPPVARAGSGPVGWADGSSRGEGGGREGGKEGERGAGGGGEEALEALEYL